MKIGVIILNVLLIGFTVLVRLTDGPAVEPAYIIFGLLLVLVPILNVVMISRKGTRMKLVAVVCNIALLGSVCWAIIDQYPHPKESGLLEFELLAILTPILSAVAVLLKGRRRAPAEPPR